MMTKYDETADLLIDQITMELLLKDLTPKEQDTLTLWLNGGYSRQEIAEIIKARYGDRPEVSGKVIGLRIQTILSKLRARIVPKGFRIGKRTRKMLK